MTTPLPKIILGYWHQGRDAAPDHIKTCWDLWARMNPNWELRILEWADVEDRFAEFGVDAHRMSLNGVANIVRLDALTEGGGVWVDAYTVPLCPLDNWLPPLMPAGFFVFHDPYRKRLSENWFIAATPGHPLALGWRDRMVAYWRKARRPMRFPRELDRGTKGQLARAAGRVLDAMQGPISARGAKKIYEPRHRNWSVSQEGGGRYPIYPYFALAMLFDLMLEEEPALFEAWRPMPKMTSYDCLLLRHWKKNYAKLTPEDIDTLCKGKWMQKLSLPTPLPVPLMQRLLALSERGMP